MIVANGSQFSVSPAAVIPSTEAQDLSNDVSASVLLIQKDSRAKEIMFTRTARDIRGLDEREDLAKANPLSVSSSRGQPYTDH